MDVPGYVPAGFQKKPRPLVAPVSPTDGSASEVVYQTPIQSPPAASRTTSRGVMTDGRELVQRGDCDDRRQRDCLRQGRLKSFGGLQPQLV